MGCGFIPDEIINPVIEYFGGDLGKVATWINAKNPMLGGVSPCEMILAGRLEKLQSFVEQQTVLNEGGRDE